MYNATATAMSVPPCHVLKEETVTLPREAFFDMCFALLSYRSAARIEDFLDDVSLDADLRKKIDKSTYATLQYLWSDMEDKSQARDRLLNAVAYIAKEDLSLLEERWLAKRQPASLGWVMGGRVGIQRNLDFSDDTTRNMIESLKQQKRDQATAAGSAGSGAGA